MKANVKWVAQAMNEFAPEKLAYENDNVGLLVGETETEVKTILVALDLSFPVIEEAIALKADMVVTHHPIMRKAVKRVTDENSTGKKIISLIKNNIAFYASHTCLDICDGGTNDVLFDMLGLVGKQKLLKEEKDGFSIGRIGDLPYTMKLTDIIAIIKKRLSLDFVSFVGDLNTKITRVGLCTGSASGVEFLEEAHNRGCHLYISGDVTFHNAMAADELGICLIDGTHFSTEVIVVPAICERLEKASKEAGFRLNIIQSERQKSPLQQR